MADFWLVFTKIVKSKFQMKERNEKVSVSTDNYRRHKVQPQHKNLRKLQDRICCWNYFVDDYSHTFMVQPMIMVGAASSSVCCLAELTDEGLLLRGATNPDTTDDKRRRITGVNFAILSLYFSDKRKVWRCVHLHFR